MEAGAVNDIEAVVVPVEIAVPIIGAAGAMKFDEIELEFADGNEVPTPLVAVIVKV